MTNDFTLIFLMISFPESIPLTNALELVLESIAGDSSELEELSDIDNPTEDADYRPLQEEPSTTEEESSGNEDPVPHPTEASRGRKRLRCETDGEPMFYYLVCSA